MELGVPSDMDVEQFPFLAGGQIYFDRVGEALESAGVDHAVVVMVPTEVAGQLVPDFLFKFDLDDRDREIVAMGGSLWFSQLGGIAPCAAYVGHYDLAYQPPPAKDPEL